MNNMKVLRARIMSFVLIMSLCVSLGSPIGANVVSATEVPEACVVENTLANETTGEGNESDYSIVLMDGTNEVTTLKDIVANATVQLQPKLKNGESVVANAAFTYSSSDEKVATVSETGLITAMAVEESTTVNITISWNDGNGNSAELVVRVNVVDIPEGIVINNFVSAASISLKAEESVDLTVQLKYASGKLVPIDLSELTITSDDENIAKVENGKVTALEQSSYPVSTTVRVQYSTQYRLDGQDVTEIFNETCLITVTPIPVEKIELKGGVTSVTKKIGETYTLEPVISPANAYNKKVKATSTDDDVATVKVDDKGNVIITAKSIGDVVITVYSEENAAITATFNFKVYQTTFNVAELGADGTDTKTDNAAINKVLKYADLIPEVITVTIPDGVYYLSDTLTVYSDTNIVLSDNAEVRRQKSKPGNTILCTKVNESVGGYNQVQNINITGGLWNGQASGQKSELNTDANLFYFGHAQNITITNTKIIDCSGAHVIELAGVKNALIENVEIYGYRICEDSSYTGYDEDKEAIQLDYCSSVSTPKMKPHDGTPCDTITIRNCNIHDYMAGIGTHTQGSQASTNIRIENNTFSNIANACVNLVNFKNVNIENNTANNCTTFLYASGSQGTLKNNTVTNGKNYNPTIKNSSKLRAKNVVTISNGSNFTIQQNTFQKAKSNGICVWNGSTAVIKNNKIKGNKLYGIRTQGSTVTLKKNTFSGNKKGAYDTYKDATIKSSDDIRAYYIDIKKSYKYKGKAIKPKIKIKGLNKKYYKVTYKNNNKPGTATITIKGKGKVKKTLTVKFKIKQ